MLPPDRLGSVQFSAWTRPGMFQRYGPGEAVHSVEVSAMSPGSNCVRVATPAASVGVGDALDVTGCGRGLCVSDGAAMGREWGFDFGNGAVCGTAAMTM